MHTMGCGLAEMGGGSLGDGQTLSAKALPSCSLLQIEKSRRWHRKWRGTTPPYSVRSCSSCPLHRRRRAGSMLLSSSPLGDSRSYNNPKIKQTLIFSVMSALPRANTPPQRTRQLVRPAAVAAARNVVHDHHGSPDAPLFITRPSCCPPLLPPPQTHCPVPSSHAK